MKLNRVTITGVDDHVSSADMYALSKKYPFVEWGILISTKQGRDRYPSSNWIGELGKWAYQLENKINLALHICGSVAKAFVEGEEISAPQWLKYFGFNPDYMGEVFSRIQINVQKYPDDLTGFAWWVDVMRNRKIDIITQHKSNTVDLWKKTAALNIRHHVLFDSSGGRGVSVLEKGLPIPITGHYCGWAGGITPENISDILEAFEQSPAGIGWIDMETGVRTDDRLDLFKVEEVLAVCEPYVRIDAG
ncbi:hypothetical protein LCGC14_0145340 [marine sediment metagenome]|uniref:phosphoribosylanthranilate isomerase n=1 Tax=marine sediment metagenome TaxID=412755 RepID=A0A0F9V387_9ZZZZ